jgi:hypothetical protein
MMCVVAYDLWYEPLLVSCVTCASTVTDHPSFAGHLRRQCGAISYYEYV